MSGRKNQLVKFQTITSGDMSQATITSAITSTQNLDNMGVQFNFTGTPTGTFFVDVSIDHMEDGNGNVTTVGNWIPVTLPSTPVASGSAGQIVIDLNQLATPWIRFRYVKTSGTGTLNAFLCGKML